MENRRTSPPRIALMRTMSCVRDGLKDSDFLGGRWLGFSGVEYGSWGRDFGGRKSSPSSRRAGSSLERAAGTVDDERMSGAQKVTRGKAKVTRFFTMART